jgi:lipoprotein-anchoring transpeptidase ErfK/SrfK
MSPARRSLPFSRRAAAVLGVTLTLAMGTAGCTGERPTLEPAAATRPATTATPTTAATTTTAEVRATLGPEDLLGYIATPIADPDVHERADATSPKVPVGKTTANGAPTTFAVIGTPGTEEWLHVALPDRPNGSTGYIRSSAVTVSHTDLRVFIDLTARTLRAERAGSEVLDTRIAIGTPQNPTPTGGAYVTELIESTEPDGAYGPYAYGLSMHSDTVTEFAGGNGQVGIHGTNQPSKIGEAVSHGCVRLTNEDVRRLVDLDVPLGMPVFISG